MFNLNLNGLIHNCLNIKLDKNTNIKIVLNVGLEGLETLIEALYRSLGMVMQKQICTKFLRQSENCKVEKRVCTTISDIQ